jgi:hypothetical protein
MKEFLKILHLLTWMWIAACVAFLVIVAMVLR